MFDKILKKGSFKDKNNTLNREFSNIGKKKKAKESIILELSHQGKRLIIERTPDWEINVTRVSKLFGKRWRDWARWNQHVIDKFELLEGKSLIREVGPKNRVQTYVALKLALRVLNDYDEAFSWHVFTQYQGSLEKDKSAVLLEFKKVKEKNELLEAEMAKLRNKGIDVDLVGGESLLYAYACNNESKWGTSFRNKNGQRPKSHKTSVPNFAIGFVVYASKEHLQKLNKAIKDRFRITGRSEHANCKIDELEDFVIGYLEVMNFPYKREDIQKLRLLNIFLKN